jgi:glucose/arabinose dehydrogenase
MGHRNVQGLAWDSASRLYASEFGAGDYDELNLIQPGGNYGWPSVEGPSTDPRYVNPIATWHSTSVASPSGTAIVGDRIYVACLAGQRLYRVSLDGRTNAALYTGQFGRLRTVERAPDGSLWVLTSNRDGIGSPTAGGYRILRITP